VGKGTAAVCTVYSHKPLAQWHSCMDFAPDTPTAGYERYVSESESTDGEGDVSGGQQRRASKVLSAGGAAEAAAAEHRHGGKASPSSGYYHGKSSSSSSILSRLAASWKKGSERASRGAHGGSSANRHHGNISGAGAGAGAAGQGAAGQGAGVVWRDMKEGDPRCGDGAGCDRGGGRCVGDEFGIQNLSKYYVRT